MNRVAEIARWTGVSALVVAVFTSASRGQEISPTTKTALPAVDFARDIEPVLASHCYRCHGASRQESNYRLDLRSVALGVADFGDPPIIAGDSGGSPLVKFVSGEDPDLVMPPEGGGDRLSADQVALLRRWVDEGALWPDDPGSDSDEAITTSHWSFQPLLETSPPHGDDLWPPSFHPANAIDRFVAARLSRENLRLSEPANRVTLIRRIYLDMLGLLPGPEQVRRFVDDDSDDAWQTVIEEVLASPHYGERWARHWLDVVRFGESTGYEVNRDRSNAWYFRDYVIDALNEDKPYCEFVTEQLAGDAVGVDVATGFLVGGPFDIVKSPDINLTLMQRQDELADYVNTTSTTFLGLTVACARCHNHKFDPILQRDYYALQAFFSGVEHGERKLLDGPAKETLSQIGIREARLRELESALAEREAEVPADAALDSRLLPPVSAQLNTESFAPVAARFVRFSIRRSNRAEPCIDELEIFSSGNVNVALAASGSIATSSGNYEGDPKHKLEHVNDGQYGNPFSWIANTATDCWVQIELPKTTSIERVVWARDRQGSFSDRLAIDYSIQVSTNGVDWEPVADSARRQPYVEDGKQAEGAFIARLPEPTAAEARKILEEIRSLRDGIKALNDSIPTAYIGTFKPPEPTFRLYRGDPLAPREEVAPDVLTVMGSLNLDRSLPEQERRLALARWIASDNNPLTARVIVNRVWQFHFGQGIVATPSDFGVNGARPTHPELLDWLARRFMENGWSLKWLHRQILSSFTYRQSSKPDGNGLAVDAACHLLWRFPPRRLEAEAIRDCILQASGKLDLQAGGPGFLLFRVDRENVHHYFPLEKFEAEHFRRMIYMTKIRQEQEDVFGVFDCPDGGQTVPNRNRSTTPLQSLNLLNSPFIVEQAEYLAGRIRTTAGPRVPEQIRFAIHLLFSRQLTDEELAEAVDFVEKFGLEDYCRALLNTNEFLFMS